MARKRRAAIFDLDGTVIDCSSEKQFAAHLIGAGVVRFGDFARWFVNMLSDLPRDASRGLKANRSYLGGKRFNKIHDLARQFMETRIKSRIAGAAYEAVNTHRKNGDLILMLSGSLDLLVAPIAEHIGADDYRASSLEVVDGVATGKLANLHPMGVNKVTVAEQLARKHDFDLSEATAYADRMSDVPLLKRVNEAIAVTPQARLRRYATRVGWQVADWHS